MCLDSFFSTVSRVLGKQFTSTPPVVFFLCWPATSAKKSATARYIIKTIITVVWLFRNKTSFRNIKDNYPAIIRFVSFDISSHISTDFLHLTLSHFLDH